MRVNLLDVRLRARRTASPLKLLQVRANSSLVQNLDLFQLLDRTFKRLGSNDSHVSRINQLDGKQQFFTAIFN